ncbi:MAG: pantoate--beta-alanine ligase, partial [Gammaproteobacteria bacterium]|nr:pantoate--beta-alanine ligase [Gammaproteobacteria bacterium]
KLLVQSRADYGFFGEKDFQQLLIVKKLVNSLDIPCKIISMSTVRDREGLAISSRNRYLKKDKKLIANNLYKILCESSKNIATGKNIELVIDKAKINILESGFTKIDYLEIRSEKDLSEIKTHSNKKSRIFVAAYINDIRLIDNIAIE